MESGRYVQGQKSGEEWKKVFFKKAANARNLMIGAQSWPSAGTTKLRNCPSFRYDIPENTFQGKSSSISSFFSFKIKKKYAERTRAKTLLL